MNEQEFYDSIPDGKNDRPMLLCDPSKPIEYDINDIDGTYFMLCRDFSGCVAMPFSKQMREDIPGKALIDGEPTYAVVRKLPAGGGSWWLGVRLRGRLVDYCQSATLEITGFTDMDGNEMVPVRLTVRAIRKREPDPRFAAHEAVALHAAEEGAVLLKNNGGVLPLPKGCAVNLFGKGMYEYRSCAVGAGKTNARYTVGFLEAMRASPFVLNQELISLYACGEDVLPSGEVLARARLFSDVAVMMISRAAGENFDASTDEGEFYATGEERALLAALRAHFLRVIVILNVGYPIGTRFLDDADAVLYCGFGGMLGGQALVNLLCGDVSPSGKLPDTWAERYEDIPASRNFYDCAGGKPRYGADGNDIWMDTVYEEDIYVGYRYFSTFDVKPAYPFGFGLSYTTFSITGEACGYDGAVLTVKVSVLNTGERAGKETVQVYLKKPDGALEQPIRELIAFEKSETLSPGEKQSFVFSVPNSAMASYSEKKSAYLMPQGVYEVYVGNSSVHLTKVGSFVLAGECIVREIGVHMPPSLSFDRLHQGGPLPLGKFSGIKAERGLTAVRECAQYPVRTFRRAQTAVTFEEAAQSDDAMQAYVAQLTVPQLARLAVCNDHGWSMEGRGEAGRMYTDETLGIPPFIVADGNSGVNMNEPNLGVPSGATLCASFNRRLMEEVGRAIGEEAKALGVQLILAPAFNIHRDPLCGRHPEYFSEDPLLAGKMAGCYCRGLERAGVGGCYKHFACNNTESSRKRNQSILSERALREIYLRAFSYAFEEYMPASVMTAYNAVNGRFTSEDADLILGFLRSECGFDGFVMTDWGSYDTADIVEMVAAGNCWITPGSKDDRFPSCIRRGISEGRITEARLRENVYFILKTVAEFGSKPE